MTMEEKNFYTETEASYPTTLHCPHCRQSGEHKLRWAVRKKKTALSPGASETDRAKFAKFSSYKVRKDDLAACQNIRCRRRFEVSGVQSVVQM